MWKTEGVMSMNIGLITATALRTSHPTQFVFRLPCGHFPCSCCSKWRDWPETAYVSYGLSGSSFSALFGHLYRFYSREEPGKYDTEINGAELNYWNKHCTVTCPNSSAYRLWLFYVLLFDLQKISLHATDGLSN